MVLFLKLNFPRGLSMNANIKSALIACAVVSALSVANAAGAQTPPKAGATIDDPAGPLPDPAHLPLVLPKDIKCSGREGVSQTCNLFGDPNKPGLYGVIIKWWPGHFSQPHFHDQDRFIYVISGTWWVSTSNVYDERTTYPVHAGMVATDVINTVHWDGARTGEKEPAVLELVGMGPVKTIPVDEKGQPKAGPITRQ